MVRAEAKKIAHYTRLGLILRYGFVIMNCQNQNNKKSGYNMQFIVLDLEWNQALSGKPYKRDDLTLAGEIIQIGAAKLDDSMQVIDSLRICVAPKYYKKMHWSVKKLTGISTQSLLDGESFPDAFRRLSEFCGEDYAFLTWGPDDLPMLRSNLRLHKIQYVEPIPWYDLQKIYAQVVHGERRQYSLADALAHFAITETHPAHDALNDALNTAMLCPHLQLNESVENYDTLFAVYDNQQDGTGEVIHYSTYDAMVQDNKIPSFVCPECEKKLTFGKWVRRSPRKRLSMAECSCGCDYILKLRWMEDEDTGVHAVRSLVPATESLIAAYNRAVKNRRRSRKNSAKTKNTTAQ